MSTLKAIKCYFDSHMIKRIVNDNTNITVFVKSFQLQDSCLADCKFLLVKTHFCRTVLYVIIVIWEIFAGHLSDRIKYFVSQNKMLLVLTDRPALFVKTDIT